MPAVITRGGMAAKAVGFTSGAKKITIAYLVVAGGGGGGTYDGSGGGGGGILYSASYTPISGTPYIVTVGGGGTSVNSTSGSLAGSSGGQGGN